MSVSLGNISVDKMQREERDPLNYTIVTPSIPRSISLIAKQYVIDAGKIMRVTNFMGAIRFRFDDSNGHFDECLFFLNSYCLKRIRTLCQVFTAGDWVAFVAARLEGGHWTAVDVRPRSGVMQGYGQFRKCGQPVDGFFAGISEAAIRPQYRTPFGGGDISISRRTYRISGQKTFEKLVDGDWLRFFAMRKPEQAPKGVCTSVAIEAEIPFLLGLVVKRLKEIIHIWCMEIGLVKAVVDTEFPSKVGDWVRMRVRPQVAPVDGQWEAMDIITTTAPPDVSVKVGRHVRVTALVVAGVLSNRFGTVWSDKLGRMTVWRWCLKNVTIKPFQRLMVRAFYNGNDERQFNTEGDAWTVYEVKIAPPMPKNNSSPSIITNIHAVVEEVCMTPREWYSTFALPPCLWRLRNETFGCIIAKPVDVIPRLNEEEKVLLTNLRSGDGVKVSMVPMSWSRSDEYRAFVVEKLPQPVCNGANDTNIGSDSEVFSL